MVSSRISEWILKDDRLSSLIQNHPIERMKAGLAQGYRELFLMDDKWYDKLATVNILHQKLGLSIEDIIQVYKIYHEEIQASINATTMPEIDRWILTSAISKRIDLIIFIQINGFLEVQNVELKRRESFYRALTDISRVWAKNKTSLEEVIKSTTEILVKDIDLALVWIGNVEPGEKWIKIIASAGDAIGYVNELHISIDDTIPEGRGPVGIALHSGKPYVLRDIEDPIFKPWKQLAKEYGVGGIADISFQSADGKIWAIAMYTKTGQEMPIHVEDLLEDLANNLKLFIDQKIGISEIERLQGYQQALVQVQTELIKRSSPEEIYNLVVKMLLKYTDALTVRISVPDPNSEWMRTVAAGGKNADIFMSTHLVSRDAANRSFGNTTTGRAFREGKAVILNDPQQDEYLQEFWSMHPQLKVGAIGSWPIFAEGETSPRAVLTIHSLRKDYFSPPIQLLVGQMVSNIEMAINQYNAEKKNRMVKSS